MHRMMPRLLCQLLGGLLVLAGGSGVLGAANRSANLLNISVVVCIMGLLLTFQFIQEARPHTAIVIHTDMCSCSFGPVRLIQMMFWYSAIGKGLFKVRLPSIWESIDKIGISVLPQPVAFQKVPL